MDKIKLGNYIKERREKQNISKEDLSNKVNIELNVLESWENGEVLPDLSIILDLANALNITSDALLSQKDIDDQASGQKRKYLYILLIIFGFIFISGIILMSFDFI